MRICSVLCWSGFGGILIGFPSTKKATMPYIRKIGGTIAARKKDSIVKCQFNNAQDIVHDMIH